MFGNIPGVGAALASAHYCLVTTQSHGIFATLLVTQKMGAGKQRPYEVWEYTGCRGGAGLRPRSFGHHPITRNFRNIIGDPKNGRGQAAPLRP